MKNLWYATRLPLCILPLMKDNRKSMHTYSLAQTELPCLNCTEFTWQTFMVAIHRQSKCVLCNHIDVCVYYAAPDQLKYFCRECFFLSKVCCSGGPTSKKALNKLPPKKSLNYSRNLYFLASIFDDIGYSCVVYKTRKIDFRFSVYCWVYELFFARRLTEWEIPKSMLKPKPFSTMQKYLQALFKSRLFGVCCAMFCVYSIIHVCSAKKWARTKFTFRNICQICA